ncbi:MAG: magnesium/cobalt transporter CorA [Planctomycetaceae bacterium]
MSIPFDPSQSIVDLTAELATDSNRSPAKLRSVACLGGLCIERDVSTDELHEYIADEANVVWLDVQDPGEAELEILLDQFGFHPLSVEDVVHPDQRPKIDEYKGYLFVVAHSVLNFDDLYDVELFEVDMFVGRNYLVTVHRGPAPPLEVAFSRWTSGGELMKEGLGFLVYTVLDSLVDAFFPVLDAVEEHMEDAEIDLFSGDSMEQVPQLLRLKRTLMRLRRIVAPLREVFSSFLRREQSLFGPQTRIYLHDVYDHVLRILDGLEMEREMLSGAVEANLSVLSNRLNATMKTLTVITIVVAMMGAVFGAWGMNFDVIPLQEHPEGFWILFIGTMSAVAASLAWAWRRRWL